jgi:hypothetical protein
LPLDSETASFSATGFDFPVAAEDDTDVRVAKRRDRAHDVEAALPLAYPTERHQRSAAEIRGLVRNPHTVWNHHNIGFGSNGQKRILPLRRKGNYGVRNR